MFASKISATIVCLVALVAGAFLVTWTAGQQEQSGRASLTQAARRYLSANAPDAGEAVLTKVETEVGGRRGFTEFLVVDGRGIRRVRADPLVLTWVRAPGADWSLERTGRGR